jgi:hypothetical protein
MHGLNILGNRGNGILAIEKIIDIHSMSVMVASNNLTVSSTNCHSENKEFQDYDCSKNR